MLLIDDRLRLRSARDRRRRLANAAVAPPARRSAMIAAIILCASIIIGVLGITGLGVKITSVILSGSGGMLWPRWC